MGGGIPDGRPPPPASEGSLSGVDMTFKAIEGGFQLSADDQKLVNTQRAITAQVNRQFVQVGAVFLKQSGKNPIDSDWANTMPLQTDLQDWIDNPDLSGHNVGFNLQFGWMDIDIDADDPFFNECMVAALVHNGVDTRFSFGRHSVGTATHVLVQLAEEEAANFDGLTKFEPKEFRIDGKRFHTQLRSYPTNIEAKNVARQAKQTVMPGSVYSHKHSEGQYDISVWYKNRTIASNVREIAATTPRRASFNQIVRAIAFATCLYVIRDHWVEGQRQTTAVKVAGWLARVVKDGQALNNHEAIAKDVFCPVDTDDIAESLIQFIADFCEDGEAAMRIRSYRDAVDKLDRNPDAKIPGWPAMEQLIGPMKVNALRTTFTPGSDVSVLTQMAERYAYDETDGLYIDRKRHKDNHETFAHEPAMLERRHIDETVLISGKPRPAFKMFETSKMRMKVGNRNMYPDQPPGSIFRVNSRGEIIPDDLDDDTGNPVFNTWRGWPILPAADVDPVLMKQCIEMLDKLLGYLTQDNEKQVDWVKEWIAWTFQHPGIKQQIAWVVVGGQGVGKSFIGNTFMNRLMGTLWGTSSASVIGDKFNIGPFINKMFVFVDEAKFHNEEGTEEVKKLIRNVDVPGMLKYGEGQNFKIYARMMFASNVYDMSIGQKSVIDRALFYTKAYDNKYLNMTDSDFRAWAETLKPWFVEFDALIERMEVREHYIRYFMDMELDKTRIESIKYSSSQDEEITSANMRPSRRIAKAILEEGRIHEDLSLEVPFTTTQLGHRISEICNGMHIRPVRTDMVVDEFLSTGILDRSMGGFTFKYRIGDLIKRYGDSISMTLNPAFELDEEDFGENSTPAAKKPWKLGRRSVVQGGKF